jgi:hypothetical protein
MLKTDTRIYNREQRSEKSMEISLFIRFVIIVAIVVSIVDIAGFYAIQKDPTRLTIPFVLLMIIATIIPIAINLWYWLVFKQG